MTPAQENTYKQQKVNQLLASDSFASYGFWIIPAEENRGVSYHLSLDRAYCPLINKSI